MRLPALEWFFDETGESRRLSKCESEIRYARRRRRGIRINV